MEQPGAPLRLLIADDCPEAAEILGQLITEVMPGRFAVDTALDGRQAVSLALAHPPTAALLDIEMPVMTGLEAGVAIRRALDGEIVLVAMSGSPARLDEARALGTFDHVLAKPFDLDELVELLEASKG